MAMAMAMAIAMATEAAPKNTFIVKIRSLPWTADSMRPNQALEAALALSRAPNLVRVLRRWPLPPGITSLLQILSGDASALAEAKRLTCLDENEIIAIVELYVLRVLLFRGASARRILGVENGAERGQMRRHMGYLMSWLHPDKSGNPWRIAFGRRVLEAWRQVDMGTDVYQPRPLFSQRRKNRNTSFVLPWITVSSEQSVWYRIFDWRRRLRFWHSDASRLRQ
jgi:hypothetical protein